MEAYFYPQYYEIAFAPAEAAREVDFFEAAIRRFSQVRVRDVFEIASGTAPYIEEWAKRGHSYCGLDLSRQMVEYARAKAMERGIAARFVEGDMRALDCKLGRFDLAYVLLGSLYLRSNREFRDHLAAIAELLAPGSLYLLDSVVWFRLFHDYRRSWTRRRGGVRVRTRYRAEPTDEIAQTYDEVLSFIVDDRGRQLSIEGRVPTKIFFPQEFLALIELSGAFEFIGWYNDFDLSAPLRPEGRHIVVLRRR